MTQTPGPPPTAAPPLSPAAAPAPYTEAAEVAPADLQQLRWGPIVAGSLTAVGIFILLSSLAIAAGLQAAPGVPDAGEADVIAILVASVIALVAFFIGGFVATWSAAVSQTGRALVNGFLVWTLWLVVVALLGALGIGSLTGDTGQLFGQIGLNTSDLGTDQLVDAVRTASWTSFLALSLTALAAMLGGTVATRDELRGAWVRIRPASVSTES